MRIPVVSDSEIRPLVARMLEERFSTESNSLVFDYSISERTLEHLELIVHVSPKHVVDSHADVFSRAGITLVSLAPKSRALIGVLRHPAEGEATLIVDIAESNTTATVVVGGVVASVSLLDFSSRQLDSDISPTFESAYPHMLRLKEAIRSCFLQWHLSLSTAGAPDVVVGTVILAGRNASFTGLAQYLSETLAVNVVVADPWRHVQLPQNEVPAIFRSHAPRYATAIGLSIMKDAFGTLLPENARNYFRRARAIKVAILALLWVSVFSLVVFIFSVSI
jgi:Tfp pilus assembly PilM family ATPase